MAKGKIVELELVEILADIRTTQKLMTDNLAKLNEGHVVVCSNLAEVKTSISQNQAMLLKLLVITMVALAILAGAEKIMALL